MPPPARSGTPSRCGPGCVPLLIATLLPSRRRRGLTSTPTRRTSSSTTAPSAGTTCATPPPRPRLVRAPSCELPHRLTSPSPSPPSRADHGPLCVPLALPIRPARNRARRTDARHRSQASSARPTRAVPPTTSVRPPLPVAPILALRADSSPLRAGTVAWGVCNASLPPRPPAPQPTLRRPDVSVAAAIETHSHSTLTPAARLPLPLHQPLAQDAAGVPARQPVRASLSTLLSRARRALADAARVCSWGESHREWELQKYGK